MQIRCFPFKDGITREYTERVDITPRDGYRCVIMVHIPAAMIGMFMRAYKSLNLTDIFDVKVRACVNFKCITFTPIVKVGTGEQMKRLLTFIAKCSKDIKWKEGRHGYVIDALGNIKRKWELEPETKQLDIVLP